MSTTSIVVYEIASMSDPAWYYAADGEARGPFTFAELRATAARGEIRAATLVWATGLTDWQRAETIDGLFGRAASSARYYADDSRIDRKARAARRLCVWACLALSGMHALGAFGSLFLKTGFLSYERLSSEQAFVAATNNMAVAVALLAIAYLYERKGHTLIPVAGLVLFGVEVVLKIHSGQFAPAWFLGYAALALIFATSLGVTYTRGRTPGARLDPSV